MKTCTVCGISHPLSNFYLNGGRPQSFCKICTRAKVNAYRQANLQSVKERKKKHRDENKDAINAKNRARYERCRAEIRAQQKEYYEQNKDRVQEMSKIYASANKERLAAARREWARNNRHVKNEGNARRRAAKRLGMPAWADKKKIRAIYKIARKLTGVHVDHIVPLVSEIVCGLHVHNNLQVISAAENQKKSNVYWPDMPNYEVEQDAQ